MNMENEIKEQGTNLLVKQVTECMILVSEQEFSPFVIFSLIVNT